MNKKLLCCTLAASAIFASCSKKDDATTPPPTSTTPPSSAAATPSYGTGDGAVVALITRTSTSTPMGNVDIDLGTGVAVFGNLSAGTYNDAGKITLNGKELTKQANNSYIYTPSKTDLTGIDFTDKIEWNVGNPAFTFDAMPTTGRGMPESDGISGTYTTANSAADFTLETDGVYNADSVYFQINGPQKSILKRMSGGTRSVTFTAAEMGTLGKSTGCSVTIAPWNHQTKTFSGKTVHVINELAMTRVIEIK